VDSEGRRFVMAKEDFGKYNKPSSPTKEDFGKYNKVAKEDFNKYTKTTKEDFSKYNKLSTSGVPTETTPQMEIRGTKPIFKLPAYVAETLGGKTIEPSKRVAAGLAGTSAPNMWTIGLPLLASGVVGGVATAFTTPAGGLAAGAGTYGATNALINGLSIAKTKAETDKYISLLEATGKITTDTANDARDKLSRGMRQEAINTVIESVAFTALPLGIGAVGYGLGVAGKTYKAAKMAQTAWNVGVPTLIGGKMTYDIAADPNLSLGEKIGIGIMAGGGVYAGIKGYKLGKVRPMIKNSAMIYDQATKNGGITINVKGTMPTDGYGVETAPKLTLEIPEAELTPKIIEKFVSSHAGELSKPNAHLGMWKNEGKWYLGISEVRPFEDAVRLGIKNKQEAIWDFSTNSNVWIKDRYAEPNTYKHYGSTPGLTELDPTFHGRGKPGEESNIKRTYPELWRDRTYLYHIDQTPEYGLGQHEYRLTKPGKVLSPDDAAWRILWDMADKEAKNRGYGEFDKKAVNELFKVIAKDKGYAILDFGKDIGAVSLVKQPVVPVAEVGGLPKVNPNAPEAQALNTKSAAVFERDIKPALEKMASVLLKKKEAASPLVLEKLVAGLTARLKLALGEALPNVPEKGVAGEDWSQRAQNMVAAINSAVSVAKVKGNADVLVPKIIDAIASDFGRKTLELGAVYGQAGEPLKGLKDVDAVFAKPTEGFSIGDMLEDTHTNLVKSWISKFYPLDVLEKKITQEHGLSREKAITLAEQFELLEGVKGKAAGQIDDFEIALSRTGVDPADLNRYNFLGRIKNYLENGYEFGTWKEEDVVSALTELRTKTGAEKWDKLMEASKLYQDFCDENLRLQVESGRLSQKEYDLIKASNDFYAKFQVLDESSKPEFTRKSLASVRPLTQERTGMIEKVRLDDTIKEAELQRESSLMLAEQNRRMQSLGGLTNVDTEGVHVKMLQTAKDLQTRIESLTKMRDLFAAQRETKGILGKTEQARSIIVKGINKLLGKKTSYRIYTLEDKIAATNAQITKLLDEARFSAESWTPPDNMNKMLAQIKTKEAMITRNTQNLVEAIAEFQMNQTKKLIPKLGSLNKIHAILNDLEALIDARSDTINMLRGIVKNTAELEVPKGMKRVQYFRNGYRETIAVEPEIAAVLSGLTSNQIGFMTQFLGKSSGLMKFGATGMSAGFQAMNFGLFDPIRMALLSKYGVNLKNPLDIVSFPFMQLFSLYHSLRGNLKHPTALYREFTDILAGNSTMQKTITPEFFAEAHGKVGAVKGAFSFVAKLSNALEEATKIHTLMRAKKFERLEQLRAKVHEAEANKMPEAKDLKDQLNDLQDKIANETRNFGGSPDFPKGGQTSVEMNLIAMFMKARLLGINSDFARLRGTAGGRGETAKAWARVATLYLLPTTILAMKNQSPEGRKAYDTLSENDKQNNIMIPKGTTRTLEDGTQIPDYWKIPKRDVFAAMDNMINNMTRYAYDKDPEYMAKAFGQLSSDMSPINMQGDTPQEKVESFIGGLHPIAKLGYEVASGRNPTFHTDIVPASQMRRIEREQETPKLFQWASGKLDVSPLVLQEYANTLTGGAAAVVAPKQKEIPVVSAITKRLERSESYQSPLAKELSKAIEAQDKETKERANEAYKYAEQWKDLPRPEAAKNLIKLAKTDKLLARTARDMILAMDKNLTFHEKQLLNLDVTNGARAKFLLQEIAGKTPEESKTYLKELAKKKILTRDVYIQMGRLKK
jgi:hypothetical protein